MMLKGYKTVIFNTVAAAPLAAELVTGGALTPFIPPQFMPHYTLAVTLVNLYLRFVTNTAVGTKK